MPTTNNIYPQPYYPITRLSNGQLISHDPGLPNTPLHTVAAANRGLKLRIYNPDSNTTHTIFNNGKTVDFDRHGRLMDRAGSENARRIHQMHYEISTGTTPYSAPHPRTVAVRPAPPPMLPPRATPVLTQARVRKDKTGFTIVIAPDGRTKYFDHHGNPSTSREWGKASRALAGPAQLDPNVYLKVGKAVGVEASHQIAKFWDGATNLAGQSLGNMGDYLSNKVHEGHGIWSGDQNEVRMAREGQQQNLEALRTLADQMTPGTFKDIADASGTASGGDWGAAKNTIAAIPQKNIQAFKDDPQQWALNFAATVAPLGENLLAKSASMSRYAAGLRAIGQVDRAAGVEARAAALKSIGNGMTFKPMTEGVEGALTKHGSKLPVVGKKITQIAETNAQATRLAQRQAATADLDRDLRRVVSASRNPRKTPFGFSAERPSNEATTLILKSAPEKMTSPPWQLSDSGARLSTFTGRKPALVDAKNPEVTRFKPNHHNNLPPEVSEIPQEAPANAGASFGYGRDAHTGKLAKETETVADVDPLSPHAERLKKYFSVDPKTLSDRINERLKQGNKLANIDDPDGLKLQDDIATYGAFELEHANNGKKIDSKLWRNNLAKAINATDTKKLGTLWKLSQAKYRLALDAERFLASGGNGHFPNNVNAEQARIMPRDSRGIPLNPDGSIHLPALEKLKPRNTIPKDQQIRPTDPSQIPFRNRHLIQIGDASGRIVRPVDIYHAAQKTIKNIGGEIAGGLVGAVAYDRSMAGPNYVPIHNHEVKVLKDEHGVIAPDAGPQYFATETRDGLVSAAASRQATSTALHTLMNKAGGTLGILVGDHGMSLGGLTYGRAHRAELRYAMDTGRLQKSDLDALTRHIVSKMNKKYVTLKGEDITADIHTFDDWYKIAPELSFTARSSFYKALGDPYLAKKVNAPTFQEVLGGFNGYHDVPYGHVVSLVHVEPGQGVGRSTAALNASDFFENPIAENTGYGFPSKGYGHGVLETHFPGLLLYHDALLEHALTTGEKYTGTAKNMMEWIMSGGGAHLTKITPDIVQRIEDWMKNPYDVEAWAKSETQKVGTHLKRGKHNV